jgi:hypothetical protein
MPEGRWHCRLGRFAQKLGGGEGGVDHGDVDAGAGEFLP